MIKTFTRTCSNLKRFRSGTVAAVFTFCLFMLPGILNAQYRERVYANTQTNSVQARGNVQLLGAVNVTLADALNQLGIDLADLGSVDNAANAVDADPFNAPRTRSRLSATYLDANLTVVVPVARVRVGALVQQNMRFPTTVAGTNPVTVKLGNSGGLVQTLLDGLTIQATLNGNPVGPEINKTNGLAGVVGNRSAMDITFTPGVLYDGVRVMLNTEDRLASLNVFQNIDVYYAYYTKPATSLVNCDAPMDVMFGTSATVSALASVTDPWDAIDNNVNTYAQLNSGANVLSSPLDGVFHTTVFPVLSKPGDRVNLIISYPGTLLEAQLLSSIGIQTINRAEDGTETIVGSFTGSSLLTLELLTGSTDKARLSFIANQPFNRIRFWYGGVAVALQSVRLYEVNRTASAPVVTAPGLNPSTNTLNVCAGSPATITITSPEAGSTYNYYTTPTGGAPITAGVSANGTTFTPTGLVTGDNVFYVSVSRNGCSNEASDRTRFVINVSPGPLAIDINVAGNGSPACANSTVVLTPSVVASPSAPIPNPVFRWYRNPDKTGEILTGTADGPVAYTISGGVLTINGLTAATTFYVSVTGSNGAGCESAADQLKAVPVNVNPAATDASIILSSSIVQCPGIDVVINPSANASVTNPVFRYYRDAGKTQPITTGSTDGAATFTVSPAGVLTVSGLPAGADVNYYVTVSGDNICENATAKLFNIKVSNTLDAPAFTSTAASVCGGGGTATFTITNATSGLTYAVYDAAVAGNLVTTDVNITGNTITFTNVNANANYFVEVTGAGGCGGVSRTQISIQFQNTAPAASILSFNANGSTSGDVCANASGSIVLTATTNVTNPTFYFYRGSTLLGSNTTGVFQVASFTSGVAVTYSVGVSGDGVCQTTVADRTSITITPRALPSNPVLTNPPIQVVQRGSTVQLVVSPVPANAASFQWYKGATLLTETSATLTLTNVTAADAGNYRVVAVGATGCTSTGDATVMVQVTGSTLWKSYTVAGGGTSVSGGEQVTYTLHLRNDGSTPISNYTLTDPVPANTTFVSATGGGTNTSGIVTWTNVNVPVGGVVTRQFVVTVGADLTGVTAIRNIAYVNDGTNPDQPGIPPDPTDPNQPGDPATPGTDIPVNQNTSTITWKSYSVSDGATTVSGGEDVTYTIHVRNTGNQQLSSVIIRDAIPANTTFVSAANGGTLIGNQVVYSNVAVGVGQTTTVSFVVHVDNNLNGVSFIRNIAVSNDGVNPDQPSIPPNPADPNQPGNPAVTGTDIPVIKTFTKVSWKSYSVSSGATTVKGGETVTYTIHVRNTGNQDLTNVSIRDAVPANTTFVSAANGGTLTAGEVRYTGISVPVGQTATVSFVVTVNPDLTGVTQITNIGYVNDGINPETPTSPPDPTDPDNPGDPTTPGTVIPVTQNPDFTAVLTVTSNGAGGLAHAGDILTYVVTLQNTGNVTLNTITVTGPVPNGTTFASADNGGTLGGGNVNFTVPSLNVGQTTTLTYRVTVNNDLNGISTISNIVAVSSATPALSKNTNQADIQTECIAPTPPPTVTLANANICAGSGNTLTVSSPDPALTYRYYSQATGGTSLGSGTTFNTGNLTATSTFYVEAVRVAGQCASATRTAVVVNVLPVFTAPVVSVQGVTANSITFTWNALAGATYEVSVNNSATFVTPSSGAAGTTHTVTGLTPGQSASIRVRAIGTLPCQLSPASASVTGTAANPFGEEVYIPNAFTPNGDGRNDVFEIYGNAIASYSMDVFNQWGELIYRSGNTMKGWDGTYKGDLQNTGVYVYKIDVTTTSGKKILKKGTITLIR